MNKEDVQKSVESIVDELLAAETEVAEKAMAESAPENGGKDQIKSGTPFSDKQAEKSEKKDEKKEMKKAEKEENEDDEDVEKSMHEKCMKMLKASKMYKSEEEMKEVASEMVTAHEKKMHKMKKSEEESNVEETVAKSEEAQTEVIETIELSEEEVELVKAWRDAQKEEATIEKSQEASKEDHTEELRKSLEVQNETLKKALDSQSELIKSLSEKIEKISSQPAYDRKGITTLEPVEKSQSSHSEVLSKSQKAEILLDLQRAGSDVRSTHVSQMESTGTVPPEIQRLLDLEINKRFK